MQENGTMNSKHVSLLLKTAQICCDVLRTDDRILAVYLLGSLARGTADSHSDIDLCVIVDTEKIDEVLSTANKTAEKVGPLLVAGKFPDSTSLMTLYDFSDSIVKVDFDFIGFDQVPNVIANSLNSNTYLFHRQLLFDRTGAIEDLFYPPVCRPLFQPSGNCAWFAVSAWSVLRMTRRGELFEAIDILNNMRDPIVTQYLCDAYDVSFENYRRLEKKLPDSIVDRLRQTIAYHSAEGILFSLDAMIKLYLYMSNFLNIDIPSNEKVVFVRILDEINNEINELKIN